MKKTYIEPKNTVVKLSLETLVATSPLGLMDFNPEPAEKDGGKVIMEGREVIIEESTISSRDAWEEW